MRVLRGVILFVVVLGSAWFISIASYEWSSWAASAVQATHEPLEVRLVNQTQTNVPAYEVMLPGWRGQDGCLAPGRKATWHPVSRSRGALSVRFGLETPSTFPFHLRAPEEVLPVVTTWRSYGVVELTLTDAGVAVTRFPDEFDAF